jgi:hypothetical protein
LSLPAAISTCINHKEIELTNIKTKLSTLALAATFAFALNSHLSFAAGETMSGNVIEIVNFKLAKGVTPDQFLAAASTSNGFLKGQKGFISRKMIVNKDAQYTDIAVWSSIEDAQNAMDASMKDQSLASFINAIDPTSMKIEHQSVILSSD